MYSIQKLPEGHVLPRVDSLITSRPRSWQGMVVEWLSAAKPVPVFLATFPALPVTEHAKDVYLFGARYDLAEALVDGQSLGSGCFVEYIVLRELLSGDWDVHRLLQHQSVTFSEDNETRDYVPASSIADPKSLCSNMLPQWKWDDAVWPTNQSKLMTFLGQLALPDTELTRALFTCRMNVYLFAESHHNRDTFKVITQETDLQTAEEHYVLE